MTELLTSKQMRGFEQATIDSGDASGLELMERAGRGVLRAIFAQWPELVGAAHEAIVLCGSGNNGGDGFVIARLLAEAGWRVRVHFSGDRPKRSADARIMHGKWTALGAVLPLTKEEIFRGTRPDVIIDAVFGMGLSRPVPDQIAEVLDVKAMKVWKDSHKIRRVAVDCPSGLDLDTGMIPADIAKTKAAKSAWPKTMNTADLTVTFHAPKLGHYLAMGPTLCRRLEVVDIGLGGDAYEKGMIGMSSDPGRVRLVEPVHLGTKLRPTIWPGSAIGKNSAMGHKYDFGHVAVFAGGAGRGGAARLAARAALRSGAGLVTVLCPPAALIENAAQLNAIMLRALKKDQPLSMVADDRVNTFCMGPGMGVSGRTRTLVSEVLARRAGPRDWRDPVVVLDADALTSFVEDPDALFTKTHKRTILTPHEGEFERLFPDLARYRRQGKSKVDVVQDAAIRAGCIILLKGVDTVIANPQGGASVHVAGYGRNAPWLSTAGAGDVLAGMIAGFAAPHQSPDLFQIAEVAVYLHVEAARDFGPGLIADDLPEQLPKVFNNLGI